MLTELFHIGPQAAAVLVPAGEANMGVGTSLAPAGDGYLPPADGGELLGHFDDHVLLLLFLNFPRICKKRRHSAFAKHRRLGGLVVRFGAGPMCAFYGSGRACALFELAGFEKGHRLAGCG